MFSTVLSFPKNDSRYLHLFRTSLSEEFVIQPCDVHQLEELWHLVIRIKFLPIRAKIHHHPLRFAVVLPLLGNLGSICQRNGVAFALRVGLVRRIDEPGKNVFDILHVLLGADVSVTGDKGLDVHGQEFIRDRDPVGEWTCPNDGETYPN
jgi:hypothetical protein